MITAFARKERTPSETADHQDVFRKRQSLPTPNYKCMHKYMSNRVKASPGGGAEERP